MKKNKLRAKKKRKKRKDLTSAELTLKINKI